MTHSAIDVIVLAGGQGSRLQPVTGDDYPKPLHKVNGKELLAHTLDQLNHSLIGNLIISVDHHAEQIAQWLAANLQHRRHQIAGRVGPGVIGSLLGGAKHVTTNQVIVCNADEIRHGFDVSAFIDTATSDHGNSFLATTNSDKLHRHRVLWKDESNAITHTSIKDALFLESPEQQGEIGIGLGLFQTSHLAVINTAHSHDWGGLLEPLVQQRRLKAIYHPATNYFNVGTPEELAEAEAFFARG